MWFLIKGTFWFSLVLVLLPFLNAESSAKLEQGPTVALGVISVAVIGLWPARLARFVPGSMVGLVLLSAVFELVSALHGGDGFGIATIGGLRQQLFRMGVIAATVSRESIGQLRPRLPRTMPSPGAERQPQQGP